jgi:crossover junction endodeoxyribonuclease RuvC
VVGHIEVALSDQIVLGVDPGSRICGYGLVAVGAGRGPAGRYRYLECGVLTAPADAPMEMRLGEIARWLTDVVTELRPTAVAVEDVFAKINIRSALALAQARGMVLAVAGMAGLQVFSYPPSVVKKTVTGRGRASKEQVASMVQALTGLRRPPRADAADALAVAITHCHSGHMAIGASAQAALARRPRPVAPPVAAHEDEPDCDPAYDPEGEAA